MWSRSLDMREARRGLEGQAFLVPLLLLTLALLVSACGDQATPTSTPSAIVVEGQRLFVARACAVCHGDHAQGTSIAPGLPGHTPGEVKRQVRAPLGFMPVFPPDTVSNDELEAIVAYISSLSAEHVHERRVDVGEEVAIHHWMTLFAIEDGNKAEAAHHIQHILELVSGDHQVRMEEALAAVEAGDLHDAAHTIEEMLAGVAAGELTEATMHVRLALSAARVEDAANAVHHMEHFVALASGPDGEAAENAMALLQEGEFDEAGHHLEEFLAEVGEAEEHADEHED